MSRRRRHGRARARGNGRVLAGRGQGRRLIFLIALGVAIVAGYKLLFGNDTSHVRRIGPTARTPIAHVIAVVTPSTALPSTALPSTALPSAAAPSASVPLPAVSSFSLPSAPVAAPRVESARLAIVIDDCGQYLGVERAMIALPIPLTLSVLPGVPYTHLIANEAQAGGKSVMMHLPMETISGLNPGPDKVTTEMTDDEIELQVRRDLAQVPLAVGVNNHEGSKASSNERVMRDVLAVLAQEHRFFVDSRTSAQSVGLQMAQAAHIPTAGRDVFLDGTQETGYSAKMLEQAAQIALTHGSAIAIGHPHRTTLAALREAIPGLQARGIHFTFVSALVQ